MKVISRHGVAENRTCRPVFSDCPWGLVKDSLFFVGTKSLFLVAGTSSESSLVEGLFQEVRLMFIPWNCNCRGVAIFVVMNVVR